MSGPYAGRNLLGSPRPIGWHVTTLFPSKDTGAFTPENSRGPTKALIPLEGCRKVHGFPSKLADRAKSGLRPLFAGALESVSP